LQFRYPGSPSKLIDLKNSFINITGNVLLADGTKLKATEDDVSTTNLLFHSLFEDVKVEFNGTCVADSELEYPYISYTNTLLGSGEGTKTTQSSSQFFYKDYKPTVGNDTNHGYKMRKELVAESKLVEMSGNLQLGIFKSKIYLPTEVGINIKMTLKPPAFYLWSPTETKTDQVGVPYKFQMTDCVLYLRKIAVSPATLAKINSQFGRGLKLRAPLKNTKVRTLQIPSGVSTFNTTDLFAGRLPEKLICGFVDTDSYRGKITHNPFAFQQLELEKICMSIEEQTIYGEELQLDYAGGKYLDAYNSLFSSVDPGEDGNWITKEDYAENGNALYGFELLCPTTCDTYIAPKPGSVKLYGNFKAALKKGITLIVIGTFTDVMEIGKDRKVTVQEKTST
jgi:hypothetical protein